MRARNAGVPAAVVGILAAVLLAGCATMAGWVGIASEEMVEEQAAATDARLAAADAEIRRLEAELGAAQAKAARLERLTGELEETIRATRELQELAGVMEGRLEELPQDTLRLLVEILQEYLQGYLQDHPQERE